MEKHADFLRDFRGDTVHASTLRLLDELGLVTAVRRSCRTAMIDALSDERPGRRRSSIDLSRIPGPHKHIALVPQWDFLELLATAAEEEPTFPAAAQHAKCSGRFARRQVIGVTYRDTRGETREMRADLTVACDGRAFDAARRDGLGAAEFRRADGRVVVPAAARTPTTRTASTDVLGAGHACALIDRGDYFQCAYIIPKGGDAATARPRASRRCTAGWRRWCRGWPTG